MPPFLLMNAYSFDIFYNFSIINSMGNTSHGGIRPLEDKLLLPKYYDRVHLLATSDFHKLKRKMIGHINGGRGIIALSSILTKDNFYLFGYKNIFEALDSLFEERDLFEWYPIFRISKESDDPVVNEIQVEFDLAFSFNKNIIKSDAKVYLDQVYDRVQDIKSNNEKILVYYLYRLYREYRWYFMPEEFIIKSILNYNYLGITYRELNQRYLSVNDGAQSDEELGEKLKSEINLVKNNPYLVMSPLNRFEDYFLTRKQVDLFIENGVVLKGSLLISLKVTTKTNNDFPMFLDEVITAIREILRSNRSIKDIIRQVYPDVIPMIDDLRRETVQEVVRAITDPLVYSRLTAGEKVKTEFKIIDTYFTNNESYMIREEVNGEYKTGFSDNVREDIIKGFDEYFKTHPVVEKSHNGYQTSVSLNILSDVDLFFGDLAKGLLKDKGVIVRVFNREIRNQYCIFKYVEIDELGERVVLSDNPVSKSILLMPYESLKKTIFQMIKADFSDVLINQRAYLVLIELMKALNDDPQQFGIILELQDTLQHTGFLGKEDFLECYSLLKEKYENTKQVILMEEEINRKRMELDNLRKGIFFNFFKWIGKFFEKIALMRSYNRILFDINDEIGRRVQVKEKKDERLRKKLFGNSITAAAGSGFMETAGFKRLAMNLDEDEKKLFQKIVSSLKSGKCIEYRTDNKFKVELYLLEYQNGTPPEMFVYQMENLEKLEMEGLITINNKSIQLSEKSGKLLT